MIDPDFDDDRREILLAERERPRAVGDAGKRRVFEHVASSMEGTLALRGNGVIASGAALGKTAGAAPSLAGKAARATLTKLVIVSTVSFLAGGGTHAIYAVATAKPRAETTVAAPPQAVAASSPVPAAMSPVAATPLMVPSDLPSAPHGQPSAAPVSETARSPRLGERALLESAHVALSRGRAEEALTTLSRHATEFPKSELAEERSALRIRALAGLGRCLDAKLALERFIVAFPDSLQRASLERLCLDRGR